MKITISEGGVTYQRDATRQEVIDLAAMGDPEAVKAKAELPKEEPAAEPVAESPVCETVPGADTPPAGPEDGEEEPEEDDTVSETRSPPTRRGRR
jgi:hypothetical protein